MVLERSNELCELFDVDGAGMLEALMQVRLLYMELFERQLLYGGNCEKERQSGFVSHIGRFFRVKGEVQPHFVAAEGAASLALHNTAGPAVL